MGDIEGKIKNRLYILIAIVVILSFLGISPDIISIIVDVFVKYLVIGAIASFVVGQLVESFSWDLLKTLAFEIEILGIKFSISAFVIAVAILKFFIFG
jgi:hypothetical protein